MLNVLIVFVLILQWKKTEINIYIYLFEKALFIRFTTSAFRKLPSIYVFIYFPFGFEGRMWDLIVSVPDHCLSFYFTEIKSKIWRVTFLKLLLPQSKF